jgi:hypothetical protein
LCIPRLNVAVFSQTGIKVTDSPNREC